MIESMIRRSKRRLIMQSIAIIGLFVAVLTGSWFVIDKQIDKTIAAKLDGDSDQFLKAPDNEARAVAVAQRIHNESADGTNDVGARRAAMILARFREKPEAVESLLGRYLDSIEPREMQNLQSALQTYLPDLTISDPDNVSLERRAKLTSLLLSIGQAKVIPGQWYAPAINPVSRTYLICHLPRWMGDEAMFVSAITQNGSLPRDLEQKDRK